MSSGPSTVVKALSVLDLVAESPGLTLSQIARSSGIPAPTALRLLRGLQDGGLVSTDSDLRYRLGGHCLYLGSTFLSQIDLKAEARPFLESLVETTGETTHLGVLDGLSVVYVDKVETNHPVRMYSRIGARSPVHSTGIGKAILAFSNDALVDQVIGAGLERFTPNTIIDGERLRSELEQTRERSYAIDNVENEAGIRCAAAPIRGADGRALGAISISGPSNRMTDARLLEVSGLILEAVGELSKTFGYTERNDDE